MSPTDPNQALQDYFADLLGPPPDTRDTSAQSTVRPQVALKPEPKPQSKRQPAFAEPETDAERKAKLERLLRSAPVKVAVPERSEPATDTAPVTPKLRQAEPELKTQTRIETKTEAKTQPVSTDTQEAAPAAAAKPEPTALAPEVTQADEAVTEAPEVPPVPSEAELPPLTQWLDNGRPDWAQEGFDVLLVDVNGLSLAVPLTTLGQIQPVTDELSPLFGQADWFMGIQPTPMGRVRVVNTARFVMPERYDPAQALAPEYLITIDKLPWALAVNEVHQPIRIDPEAVKWRADREKQPWFAGVLKEQMCVLLDIPTLGHMLLAADRH